MQHLDFSASNKRLSRLIIVLLILLALIVLYFGVLRPMLPENPRALLASAPADVTPTPSATASPSPTPEPAPEQFSIIWLSDTQTIAYRKDNRVFQAMGEWIVAQQEPLNIRYIVQTGDLVDNGYVKKQWDSFDIMAKQFFGKIPYLPVAGNHDLGIKLQQYDAYLEIPYVKAIPKEQTFENGKAVYAEFQAGGQDFLLLGAGWGADVSSVDWMNRVLQSHPNHVAILLFHSYVTAKGDLSYQGDEMRDLVVAKNPNVRLVLSGHIRGSGYRLEEFDDDGDGIMDRQVHAMLYNYQEYPYYSSGHLRVLTFDTATRDIHVYTYSPYTDRTYADSHFKEKEFDLLDAF